MTVRPVFLFIRQKNASSALVICTTYFPFLTIYLPFTRRPLPDPWMTTEKQIEASLAEVCLLVIAQLVKFLRNLVIL